MLSLGTPAAAQDQALSLLPQDQPARSPWSLFTTRITAEPAATAEPEPQAGDDAGTAAPAEGPSPDARTAGTAGDRKGWKLVKVPLPPIPDRPRRQDRPATVDTARAAIDTAAPTPPQPQPTGVFALLFSDKGPASQPEQTATAEPQAAEPAVAVASPAAAAIPASPASGTDLSNPLRPRNLPGPTEAEDDLDLEETQAGVIKQVSRVAISCLKPELLAMIRKAGDHFGAMPVITSGHRASGRRGSLHRSCEAADFVIPGVETHVLAAYLRKQPEAGGVGTYCHTKSVHLDTGEARDWRYCGFSRRFALRSTTTVEIGSR